MSLIYLYALTVSDTRLPRGKFPHLRYEQFNGFQAVYEEVSKNEYDAQNLSLNMQDAVWVAKIAQKHDFINNELFSEGAIVPFRVATIFNTLASLQKQITDGEKIYKRTVGFLTEKAEWGVKFYFDKNNLHLLTQGLEDAEVVALRDEINQSDKGKSFLLQKKLDKVLIGKVDQTLRKIIDEIQIKLMIGTVGIISLKNQSNKITGRADVMVRNLTFLLENEAIENFEEGFGQQRLYAAARGIVIEKSGPWPAYNFIF